MKKQVIALLFSAVYVLNICGCSKSESSTANKADNSVSDSSQVVTEPPEFVADDTPLEYTELADPDFTAVRSQHGEKAAEREELYKTISDSKDFPCVNITTQDEEGIYSRDEYVAAIIDIFNCDERFELSAAAGVKVRGNSTADQGDEKPYRIKFEQKQNMMGLHDGKEYKSWVLMRSFWNLAPDYTAFNLAKAIFEGKYYSSDCTYVNVYVNGRFRNVYLLCEQNQVGDDRVDVYEPKKDETQIEIGYLLELDNYAEEHPFFNINYEDIEFTDIQGETRSFLDYDYSVKSDINTQGQLDFIHKYTDGVFRILYEAVENNKPMMFDTAYDVVPAEGVYETAMAAVDAVIDLESLANMLILEELVHDNDVGEGSFYMAIDFTENSKYKKMTFLAPWDFNWAYEGSPNGSYYAGAFIKVGGHGDRTNYWFTVAMKADWFADIVKEKWTSLSESKALKTVLNQVAKDVELLRHDLGENEWSVDSANDIINFVYGRIDWLDKVWL